MKFKVGDKVRVFGKHYHCFEDGSVGEVTEVYPKSSPKEARVTLGCGESQFIYERDLELSPTKPEAVNNPAHYGTGKIECIEYIKDFLTPEEFIGYLRGNIAKYLHRWRYKNGLEDLKKAEWYLKYLIKFMQETK